MNGFLPPVIFEVKAKAADAIAEFKKINNELSKMDKNSDKATLGMLKMEKAARLTKIAMLGLVSAFGVFAVSGVKAAMEQEAAMAKLKTAVDNTGQSFQAAAPYIDSVSKSLIQLGFHDEETYNSLAKLTAATGDVKVAMKSMNVAADLARFKQISLSDAADLLARASTGQAKGLRDLGLAIGKNIDKSATYEQLLAKITERTKGAAQAFGDTAAGKLAIFNAQLDQLKEQVGMALLPALIKFTDWLNKKAIPAIEKFFKVLKDNKDVIAQVAAALAGLWLGGKIVAGIQATIIVVQNLTKAFIITRNAVLGTRIAMIALQRLPLFAMISAALYGAKKIYDLFHKSKPSGSTSPTAGSERDFASGIDNIGVGAGWATDQVNNFSDALINAKQKIKDFNDKVKSTFVDLKGAWVGIVGKDFANAIQEGLLNPVDKLVVKSQNAVSAYQSASNKYQGSLAQLKSAQDAYTKAVAGGNKTLIASTESALKKAEDLVSGLQKNMGDALSDIASLQQDMIDAVVEAQNKINDLQNDRKTVLADGLAEELALQKDYNAKVLALQQDAAKRSAEIVKTSVDQMRGIFKGATYRGVGDIFSGLTFEGKYLKGGSIEAITNALATQAQKATSLADKAGKLQGLGFTQTFIEEVIAQGPDVGGALADTIINGTPESVAQLQSYWIALEKVSSHGIDTIATKLNSGITLATEELTAQLAQVQTDLTTALSDAYSEYSASLDKIRAKTSEQIKLIDEQITELTKKIEQLRAALAQLAMLSAPGVPTPPIIPPVIPPTIYTSDYAGDPFGKNTGDKTIIINQNNNTNADAGTILAATAWAIRSSGDLNFTETRAMERDTSIKPTAWAKQAEYRSYRAGER